MPALKDILVTEAMDWANHPVARKVEAWRKIKLADTSLVSDAPGIAGPFDDQTMQKAVRGSKNRENCSRLSQAAAQYGSGGIVELGTNLGISSAYLAIGASRAGEHVRIATGDCSEKRLLIAEDLHKECGINNVNYVYGFFENTAPSLFSIIPTWSLAFIDGEHTYDATVHYYDLLRHYSKGRGVLAIFDDIEWSEEMMRAWRDLSRGADAFEAGGMGFLAL